MNRRRNDDVVKIALTAIWMALSIALSRLFSFYIPIAGVPMVEVGLQTIPILVCSFVCGPFYGALCGGGVDLLTAVLFPVGPFFPGFTLDAALLGFLPGFAMKIARGKWKREASLAVLVLVASTVGLASFLPFVGNVKIGDATLTLSRTWLFLLPFLYAVFLIGLSVLAYALDVAFRKRKKERKNAFTLLDCFVAYLARDFFLRPFLAPVWLSMLYEIPYPVGFLSQLLGNALALPLQAALLFLVLYPVSRVCRREIASTYPDRREEVYTTLRGGRNLSSPFLILR